MSLNTFPTAQDNRSLALIFPERLLLLGLRSGQLIQWFQARLFSDLAPKSDCDYTEIS